MATTRNVSSGTHPEPATPSRPFNPRTAKRKPTQQQEIKNDIAGEAEKLKGADPETLLTQLGFPYTDDGFFEDATKGEHEDAGTLLKAKDKPDWCFMGIYPQISAKVSPPCCLVRRLLPGRSLRRTAASPVLLLLLAHTLPLSRPTNR